MHTVWSMAADLEKLQARWREALSRPPVADPSAADEIAIRVLALLPERLVLTSAAASLQVTPAQARAALDRLRAGGIVGKAPVGAGLEGYFAVEVLEMVEEAVRPQSQTHFLKPASWPINYAGVQVPPG